MLYNVVENDWEKTYVPTALGNALLAVVLIVLLAAAVLFARKRSAKRTQKLTVRQLTFCAMAIALGTVLSNIKLFEFPTGGSLTLLSMLVICLPGYWFGPAAGILTAVAYGVLQLIIDPYVIHPLQLVLDYLLGFGALGLSGFFSRAKGGLLKGYCAGVLGRYVCTVLSGWRFFSDYTWEGWNPLPYSLAYNAIYIFAEAAITVIILLLPPVKKAMGTLKKLALGA